MVKPLLGLSMDQKCLTHPKSFNFDLEIMWVTIIRNMLSNKTFPHYVTSLYSKKMTHAYTYSHVAHINTLTTFALADTTKSLHAIAQTLPTHPTMRYFTLINVGHIKDKPPKNAIPT
jgi:hypothetical protein